ncbi:hypothetical protein XENTR_v10003359 [Xenopus tropicalis]|nr:hypothetical protein XENTR_v10003359 [Xenopus tropicalis]KAE8574273.1 hypothetical protein XENTR_v10003359 [Xenopus tropicalis]
MQTMCRPPQAAAQESGSERLPEGWAHSTDLYTLRYGSPNSQFLLKALTVEGAVIVHLMDMQTEKVADVTLQVSRFIDSAHLQEYPRVYKNAAELRGLLDKELISPVLGSAKEPGAVTPGEQEPRPDPLRVPPRAPPARPPAWCVTWKPPPPNSYFPLSPISLCVGLTHLGTPPTEPQTWIPWGKVLLDPYRLLLLCLYYSPKSALFLQGAPWGHDLRSIPGPTAKN